MKTIPKVLVLLVVVPATFYFCQMAASVLVFSALGVNPGTLASQVAGGSASSLLSFIPYLGTVNAVFAAAVAGWFMWGGLSAASPGMFAYALRVAIMTGSGLFALGFAGPIVTGWGGNQGPILGFIIGPIGFVLGLAAGVAIYRNRRAGVELVA